VDNNENEYYSVLAEPINGTDNITNGPGHCQQHQQEQQQSPTDVTEQLPRLAIQRINRDGRVIELVEFVTTNTDVELEGNNSSHDQLESIYQAINPRSREAVRVSRYIYSSLRQMLRDNETQSVVD